MTDPGRGGMPAARAAARWLVSGRVQGVGFRYHVLRAAERHGLRGDVRNLADGRVEVRVIGPPERVAALRDAVRTGPAGSRVTLMETHALEPESRFDSFSIV